jgi:lysyl endopeptidase
LAFNDDAVGLCSQMTYTFTASCRTYELREGCWSSGSCGGQVYYSASSAAAPTFGPTLAPLTHPSSRPSVAPSPAGLTCPAYSASNTNSATINYFICPIFACPGNTVTMTTLSPGSCNRDTYLRLYDPSTGEQLAFNDDFGGLCSQMTYTFTASCRTYELREGCWSSGSCGGQVYYTGTIAAPTFRPTATPRTPSRTPPFRTSPSADP